MIRAASAELGFGAFFFDEHAVGFVNDSGHRWNGGPQGAWMMIDMLHDFDDAVTSTLEYLHGGFKDDDGISLSCPGSLGRRCTE